MKHYKNAKRIAKLLDSQFSVLGFKFGLEPIIGLVPWLGDTITLFLSLYIVYAAITLKLPISIVGRLILNIAVDYLVGLVPLIGDLVDFIYKANEKNFRIIEKYAKE